MANNYKYSAMNIYTAEAKSQPKPLNSFSSGSVRLNAIDFPTNLGSWGRLLATYYDFTREELPGEIDFWKNQIKKSRNVLEIGAGTGFLSKHLVGKGRTLTLVEPEEENCRILKRNLLPQSYQLHTSRFERCIIPPQDYILFPYDSIPMLPSSHQRNIIIQHAAASLGKGGIFGIHISTRKWAEKYIAATLEEAVNTYEISDEMTLVVKRMTKELNRNEYLKLVSVQDYKTGKKENYLARTVIVEPEEILAAAKSSGLRLKETLHSFEDRKSNDIDLIYIFEKSSK